MFNQKIHSKRAIKNYELKTVVKLFANTCFIGLQDMIDFGKKRSSYFLVVIDTFSKNGCGIALKKLLKL